MIHRTALIFFLSLISCRLVSAQIPDHFVNLEVLSSEIKKSKLLQIMKGFTRALGVRCAYCHVGEEGTSLSKYDFASDNKSMKRKARQMLKMLNSINHDYLPTINKGEEYIRVECITCHRGQSKPKMLEDVLWREAKTNGTDSVISQYRKLREKYYGGFTYDFSDRPLNRLAEMMIEDNFPARKVIPIYKLNIDFNPSSGKAHLGAAKLYEKTGMLESAADSYQQALSIWPGYPGLTEKIYEIKTKK